MRIVFFGTSSFAARVLSSLLQHSYQLVAVVTQPDRPRGRHLHSSSSPVKEIAVASHLPVIQPEKISTPEYAEALKSTHPDLFLVVAYGEIIKKFLLDIPRLGSFNIHASLLPKYRGAAPIQRCLMNGETQTGINLIEMTPQMDAGDIVASAEVPIPEEMTFGELEAVLCAVACHTTLKFLQDISLGKIIKKPQDHSSATFAPKITPEDQRIHWNSPARSVHNRIRALSPTPGAWCPFYMGHEEKRVKITRSKVVSREHGAPAGAILSTGKEGILIACEQEALLLLEVQMEGKKVMAAGEFLKGVREPFSFNA